MLNPETAFHSFIILAVGLLIILVLYAAKRILFAKTKGLIPAVVKALYAPLLVCIGLATAYAVASTAFSE
ncbi:MAG TPA: hypothetical protein O0X63_05405, partial [Methanocorpusculum sp.]|nr:hypothetical protein [Methanocorpusculum sp.]